MHFIRCNGLNVHFEYLENPGKPVFTLVNSLGTDFRIWDEVTPLLHEKGAVLRYDKMGHGLTEFSEKPYQIADYAADLKSLWEALGIEKCVLVGLSIGGIISQFMGIHHPDRLEKLVLCNTAPKVGTDDGWNARMEKVRAGGTASIADAIMRSWFSQDFRTRQPEIVRGVRTMLSHTATPGYLSACLALRDNDLTDRISSISIPALFLAGTADGSTPPELVKAASELIPGAGFCLLQGSGHIPCVEKPRETAQVILDFVFNQQT